MKRILKVVLPLILVLALIAGACWFFLYQRPDLAVSFLLNQASTMTAHQRFDRATLYYSWAWSLEPQRKDIPIALAETYAAEGNYTKAEYTLVKAISSQPDQAELYAALCRTYVVQDKFLDAVQMLDRTTDETVKAELDALRPEAPVITPESGYYSEYIDITVEADAPRIYVTTDGQYPSADDQLYAAPLTLAGGETTVLALAVSEDGLVSPVTRNGYTIGGIVEPVTLTDPAVDRTVREQLGLSASKELMSDVLWSITNLTLPEDTETLQDLPLFTGLKALTIQNISGMDFSALSQIPSLQELDLSGCTLSSGALQAIGSLAELRKLTLQSCAITDLSALSQLTKLQSLYLSNNSLTDIGVVSLFLDLEVLDLSNNPLTSIAALSTCAKLQYLDITDCSVTTLGSLGDKAKLTTLLASNNQIRSLDELAGCQKLETLEVAGNLIDDISVLVQLPHLVKFEGKQNSAISAIPDFDEESCQLVYFGIGNTLVEDLTGLAGIGTLNYVNADYTQVKDLLPLADNRNLVQVNVWACSITQESLDALEESSIIVNYNPNLVVAEEEEGEEAEEQA